MGFLDVLGKIGKGALNVATGGISGTVMDAIGGLGNVASGAAQGSADQRGNDAQLQALYQQLAQQTARDQANFSQQGARDQYQSEIEGAKFGASEQQRGMRNALISQLLGGVQDVNISGGSGRIPQMQVSGGLRPSMLDAGGGGGAQGSSGAQDGASPRAALMAQLTQPTMQAPTYTAGAPYQAPAMPEMPEAGMLEKILGGAGLGGSILGAIGQARQNRPQLAGGQNPLVLASGLHGAPVARRSA